MPAATTKVCQKCGISKPLSQYHHNTTRSDNHNGICKDCQNKVNKSNN